MTAEFLPLKVQSSYLWMTKKVAEATARSDERAKATHARFNVFSTLHKETNEVRLHTRFLHCLLDPRGEHDCGSRFLDLFFKTLKAVNVTDQEGKKCDFHLPPQNRAWTIYREASRGDYGQIDLLLESSDFGIAIENKINAKEQTDQLSRYAAYLRSRYGEAWCLIYLTLDGKQGYTAGDEKYVRISYASHVSQWLEECLRESYQIVPINQVLLQYRTVVRRITNQNLDADFMEPIVNFIRQNPDIVRYKQAIQESVEAAIQVAWNALEQEISSGLQDYQALPACGVRLAADGNAALILVPPAGSIFCDAPFEIWVERDEQSFGIGICKDRKAPSPADENMFKLMLALMKKKAGIGFHQSDETLRFPVGWHNLLEGSPDEQAAQLMHAPDCTRILREILTYLRNLEEAFIEAKAILVESTNTTP